ncbi:MAG: hypothetical protein B0D92_02035 [Spirochaeta sp. LUC14_002_19_P3]|nr:MAG: hypothetical protein B0D92_02035 [Spirochaeta sp. LUC14_002_19_P3]
MKTLIQFILSRPIAAAIAFLAIAAGGILAILRMPLDFLPKMEVPQITVVTSFGGLPAADVRELVTIPLEDALSSLSGLKNIRSYSRDSSSLIQISLEWGASMDTAALQVREIIDTAYLSLPSQADKPLVLPVDPGEAPVILLGVFPQGSTNPALAREMAERELRAALQQIAGTGSIQVSGGRREIIEVSTDQSRLSRTGLPLSALTEAIGGMNAEYPSGSIEDGDIRYIIKADGRRRQWEDIAELTLQTQADGQVVRVRDTAQVKREFDKRQSFLVTDGEEGTAVAIRRGRGYSPVSLSRNLRARLPALRASFERDLRIEILHDYSEEITLSIRRLLFSGLTGAAAAFLVLWLFLHRAAYAFIALTAIPLSILAAILTLRIMGISLNIMSLGGLTLGVGMLVDNAIVVLENLAKKARTDSDIAPAAAEIVQSTLGSTLTSIAVFVPLLFLPGLTGELFSDLAWAIVISLGFSLLVSIGWVPLLYSRLRRWGGRKFQPSALARGLAKTSLRRPVLFIIPALFITACAAMLVPGMGFRWLQPIRQSRIEAILRHPPGTSVEHIFSAVSELVVQIRRQPGIASVSASGGGNLRDPYFIADPNRDMERSDLLIFLEKDAAWTPAALREFIQGKMGEAVSTEAFYPPDLLSRVLNITEGYTRLMVSDNTAAAAIASARAYQLLAAEEITITPSNKKPQIRLRPDRQALSRHGLSLAFIAENIGTAVNGQLVSSYEEAGRRLPIRVRLRPEDRANRRALENLNIMSTEDGPLTLGDLTLLSPEEDYAVLYREGRRDAAYLEVPTPQVADWIQRGNGRITDPQAALRAEQRSAFLWLFGLAAGLLYVLLGMQFNSFLLPLLFLLVQPVSIAGSILLLRICGQEINLNSLLGMLVVLGLSINNAILLFEAGRRGRIIGLGAASAAFSGALSRMRPILITAGTTIAALLPIALDFSGRNPQNALGLSVTGGLLLSIPAALLLLPALFAAWFRRQPAP